MHKSDARYTLAKDTDTGKVMHATPLRPSFSFLEWNWTDTKRAVRGVRDVLGVYISRFLFYEQKDGAYTSQCEGKGKSVKGQTLFLCLFTYHTNSEVYIKRSCRAENITQLELKTFPARDRNPLSMVFSSLEPLSEIW